MVPFLEKFFPNILRKIASAEVNMYCVYDSQILTLFTSSLYLAGLVSSLAASRITIAFGRRNIILFGGIVFFVGSALNAGAENIAMLILGRILLGIGVGFTNQVSQHIHISYTAAVNNEFIITEYNFSIHVIFILFLLLLMSSVCCIA